MHRQRSAVSGQRARRGARSVDKDKGTGKRQRAAPRRPGTIAAVDRPGLARSEQSRKSKRRAELEMSMARHLQEGARVLQRRSWMCSETDLVLPFGRPSEKLEMRLATCESGPRIVQHRSSPLAYSYICTTATDGPRRRVRPKPKSSSCVSLGRPRRPTLDRSPGHQRQRQPARARLSDRGEGQQAHETGPSQRF